MGKRMRLARSRKTAGYTQEGFAEALGVDRCTVARWERGEQEPLPHFRRKMAHLLAVSPDELTELLCTSPPEQVGDVAPATRSYALGDHAPPGAVVLPVLIEGRPAFLPLDTSALRLRQHRRGPPVQEDGGHTCSSTDGTLRAAEPLDSRLHTVVELSGGIVRRRSVLLGMPLVAAAFAESALFALTTSPVADVAREAGNRRIGLADVEILSENIAHLRRMDFGYGSGTVRGRAITLLHNETTTLLRGSYSDTTGRALLTAVAQAARLAGSMAADVGRVTLAQRYYTQALNLATNAGNRLFAATMLGDMSRLTIQNATGKRCARQAVALARAGTTVAGKATPTLAAQLSAMEARGQALWWDTGASRTAVVEAEKHHALKRAGGEPQWLNLYTEAELMADLGRALRDSGEPASAARLLTRTLDSYEPWRVRSRCFVQTDLAATYLLDGDHEHAVALIREALCTAADVRSGRTISRIRALQQQIRPIGSAGMETLDEEITDFLRRVRLNEDITA